MTAPAAVGESEAHLAPASIIVGNMDVLHPSSVGRIAAGPVLQLTVDAAVRTAHVNGLALRVQRHHSGAGDAGMPNRRDRLCAWARSFDRCEF